MVPKHTIRDPQMMMNAVQQRLPASLTRLDAALAALLDGVGPATIIELPLLEALGRVAAEMAPLNAYPQHAIAQTDGWALRAGDLVGASAYSPLPLITAAHWVETGDPIPAGCDCVIDADGIDQSSPIPQALTEVPPGHGVRRRGDEFPEGFVIAPGTQLRPLDILFARAAGLQSMKVRRPALRLVNVPAADGDSSTAQLIQECARCSGADVTFAEPASRDATSIADALETSACDLMVTIGGSGVGRTDTTVLALTQLGDVIAHGLALRPGLTSAVAKIGNTPVIALSGSTASALAAWWTLVFPVLDRLSGRHAREITILPLARKLASSVGIAEIALLELNDGGWMPLALGDLPFQALTKASAWLVVPADSEGFAAGTPVGAYMLR